MSKTPSPVRKPTTEGISDGANAAAGRVVHWMSRSLVTLPLATAAGVPQRYRDAVPTLFAAKEATAKRTFEFFAVGIRNANTRQAYARAV